MKTAIKYVFFGLLLTSCAQPPAIKSTGSYSEIFTSNKLVESKSFTAAKKVRAGLPGAVSETAISRGKVELVPQTGHHESIFSLAIAHSGKFFVSAGKDSSVKLWRPDGVLIRTINVGYWVSSVTISTDDKMILVGGWGNMSLWSVDGRFLKAFPLGGKNVGVVAFSPDSRFAIAGLDLGYKGLYIFNLNGMLHTKILAEKNGKYARAIKFISNTKFVSAMENNELVLATVDGKILKRAVSKTQYLSTLNIDSTYSKIVTSGYSYDKAYHATSMMELWNADGTFIRSFPAHDTNSILFSYDNKKIYSIGKTDGKIMLHDLSGKLLKEFRVGRVHRAMHTAGQYKMALFPSKYNGEAKIVTSDNTHFPGSRLRLWTLDGTAVGSNDWSVLETTSVKYFPDGQRFVTGSYDKTVKIWSKYGVLLKTLKGHREIVHNVAISPDGSRMTSAAANVIIWDNKGHMLKRINGHKLDVEALAFSKDSRYLFTGDGKGYVRIIDLRTYKIKKFRVSKERIYDIAVHPYKKVFAVGSEYDALSTWTFSGQRLHAKTFEDFKRDGRLFRADAVRYSADGKQIAVISGGGGGPVKSGRLSDSLQFYDENTDFISSINVVDNQENVAGLAVSASGKWLAATINRNIMVYDFKSHKIKAILRGHVDFTTSVAFSPDEKYIVSTSSDSQTKIWNIESGRYITLLDGKNEWLMYTPEGYFDGSKYGGKLLSMSQGINTYSVDQFALQYNRPDLIYKSMDMGNENYIAHFYRQYEKRLKKSRVVKLGATTVMSVPKVSIVKKNKQKNHLELDFNVKDSINPLARYQVYVNDVPLYEDGGKNISGQSRQLHESIELGYGKNKIEISSTNEIGGESLRAITYANNNIKTHPCLYYLGFGVSKYKKPSFNLGYAAKDVLDIAKQLEKYRHVYSEVKVKTFVNEQVTPESIHQAKQFLTDADVDDVVVLFIAGHGMYNFGTRATYYFITYQADLDNLASTAASFESVENLLQGIKSRNKLFLIDTCESGEVDDDDAGNYMQLAKNSQMIPRALKLSSRVLYRQPAKRHYLYNRDRYIYNDLQRRSGAVVFSSSRGGEFSYESDRYKNGFFTEQVLKALSSSAADKNHDNRVSTHELQAFVSQSVAKASNNLQHPTVDRDNIYQQFSFPIAR